MKPIAAKSAIVMIARSEIEGWYAGDRLMAAALFYPLPPIVPGERYVELAFACRPEFKKHLLPFLRAAELTRARLALNAPVRVRAMVRSGHRPGARLAALCDMVRLGSIGPFDQWEFEGRPHVQIHRRDRITVQRAGHVGG
ncbi:hypothetical protein [Tardiphaga sp.]|uniref:hypothetical protein n=1 Tax=Tardiphaga sp. TaxID=1926292 RepID=UPI0037D9D1AF